MRGCCGARGSLSPPTAETCCYLTLCPSPLQFQKFLSLSRPSLEGESPALEQPKALRPLTGSSSSISVVGKVSS